MFFFSSDTIFTEQGLLKLACFKQNLDSLKSRLGAYETNKKNADASSPILVTWSDCGSDVDLSYNFIASESGLSSRFSETLLDNLIILVTTLNENNSKSYWNKPQHLAQVKTFFNLFSDKMDNFSPDCFDLLSAEIAAMYLQLLVSIDIETDLIDKWILRAMSAFKNVRQLIDFVKKNTEYSLELFQLACRNKYLRTQDHQVLYDSDVERSELNQLIIGCRDTLSFVSSYNEKKSLELFRRMKQHYIRFLDSSLSDEENYQLSVAQVIERYNSLIQPHVLKFMNRPYLDCVNLDSVFSAQKLTTALNEQKKFVQLSFLYSESFYTSSSLYYLIAMEAPLYFPEYDGEEIKPQGFIAAILRSSNEEASMFLEKFVNLVAEFRNKLSSYCVPGFRDSNRDAGKIKLATELLGFISTLFKETSETSLFVVEGVGQLLARLLRDHYKHQLVCKHKGLSYGNFGTILSDTLLALCQLIKQYQYTCDPYWKLTLLKTLIGYNPEKFGQMHNSFTYPSIENNDGNLMVVTRDCNQTIIVGNYESQDLERKPGVG